MQKLQYLEIHVKIELFHSYIYSTTKHEILQISNHNLLCSLDPSNQSWFVLSGWSEVNLI